MKKIIFSFLFSMLLQYGNAQNFALELSENDYQIEVSKSFSTKINFLFDSTTKQHLGNNIVIQIIDQSTGNIIEEYIFDTTKKGEPIATKINFNGLCNIKIKGTQDFILNNINLNKKQSHVLKINATNETLASLKYIAYENLYSIDPIFFRYSYMVNGIKLYRKKYFFPTPYLPKEILSL